MKVFFKTSCTPSPEKEFGNRDGSFLQLWFCKSSGKNHTLTDERRAERLGLFKSQFSFTADEISANPHLETFGKATECQHTFDRNCSNLMKVFRRTWPGRAKQQDAFMAQFKPEPWRKLPRLQHLPHNVRHCYACAHKLPALHTAFPVRATTKPKNTVSPMAFKLAGKSTTPRMQTNGPQHTKQPSKFSRRSETR